MRSAASFDVCLSPARAAAVCLAGALQSRERQTRPYHHAPCIGWCQPASHLGREAAALAGAVILLCLFVMGQAFIVAQEKAASPSCGCFGRGSAIGLATLGRTSALLCGAVCAFALAVL